jgi:hypothetical protein
MQTTPQRTFRSWRTLAALAATLVALLASGCADMPLNKPSALSPAHHSDVEAP